MSKLSERTGFDLADAFASDSEAIADLCQRHRMIIDAETGSKNLFLALFQSSKLFDQGSTFESSGSGFEWRDGRFIGNEIPKFGLTVVVERRRQRHKGPAVLTNERDPFDAHSAQLGDFLESRCTVQLGGKLFGALVDQ
jgi:hypothetical protein